MRIKAILLNEVWRECKERLRRTGGEEGLIHKMKCGPNVRIYRGERVGVSTAQRWMKVRTGCNLKEMECFNRE